MTRGSQLAAPVSVADLLDKSGQFKRPEDLTRRVREELTRFAVDAEGRIRSFRFRPRTTGVKRKKKRITKAMEREILRRLKPYLQSKG